MQAMSSNGEVSQALFGLLRIVVTGTVLIAQVLVIRWGILTFLGNRGRQPARRRHWYAGVDVAIIGLLLILHRPIQRVLTHIAGGIIHAFQNTELGWVQAGATGMYSLLVATAVLLIALDALGALHWFVEKRLEAWQARLIASGMAVATSARWHLSRILRTGNYVLRRVLLIVLLLIYYPYTLNAFPRTRPIVTAIGEVIAGPLREMERATENYIPNLGYIFVLVLVGWIITKIMKYLFSSIAKGNIVFRSFPAEWAEPTYALCRTLLIVFILMAAYPYLPGSKSEFFRGFSLLIGAIVTFSSGGAVSNVLAGIVLTYTRAFREGDVVRIDDVFGRVTEKTLLSTRVTTIGHEQVTIPNGKVLSNAIINYSTHPEREAVSISVGATIGYDVDWRTIHKLLLEGASRTAQVRVDPPPHVFEASFGNYSVQYELRAWAVSAEGIFETYAALRRNILDAFNEAGVEIMTPTILAHRDANDLAVPEERFAARHGSRGIAVTINPVNQDGHEPLSDPSNVPRPADRA